MAGDERWAAIEDVGRLRDGLGVPVPPGTPDAFTEPVDDPLADLVARYARTHGPFTTDDVAARLGLGGAVVRHTLQRLAAQGRVLDGEFRPSGAGTEWCDAEVLRRLRRRSLARLRQEIEPVEPDTLGRFLPAWQHVGGRHRGVDGVLTVIDQLAGCPVPASALEPLVLAGRVRDYEPSYLDELTASGEVVWAGHAALPGADGWVSLHLADQAPLTLPDHQPFEHSELHQAVLDALAPGGAWFFRQLSDPVGSTNDATLSAALWDLVWAGRVSNDTLTPLRALTRGGTPGHRSRRPPPRLGAGRRRSRRTGPPETAGRWALLPRDRHRPDPARARDRRAAARPARRRHPRRGGERAGAGRVRRRLQGAVRVRGLRPLPARLLRRRPRRRAVRHRRRGRPAAHLLRDPDRRQADRARAGRHRPGQPVRRGAPLAGRRRRGHRPGRKAGAIVVLVDGTLTMYVERGGRTLLTWTDDPDLLGPSAASLAEAARRGTLGRMTVEKADGEQLLGSGPTPLREALQAAGFVATPRGLRLRTPGRGCLRATRSAAPPGGSPKALDGRVLTRTDFRVPQHATADLAGATVVETVSRGKHLLTRIDADVPVTLHTHLKMEGSWRVFEPGKRWNPQAHEIRVVLETAGPTAVGYLLGIVELLPRDREADAVGHLGPDLLGPDWDEAEALRRLLAEPDRPVFEALRDQTNLAGIGTIYAAEVCFVMGVAPETPVGDGAGPAAAGPPGAADARPGLVAVQPDVGLPAAPVPTLRHAGARRPARSAAAGAHGVLVPVLPAASGSRGDDAGLGRRPGAGSGRRRPPRAPQRWRPRAARRRAGRRARSTARRAARRTLPSGHARSRRCSPG